MVAPPAGAPGLLAQPLMGDTAKAAPSRGVTIKNPAKVVKPDPATSGVKLKGNELKKAVAKVKALPWNKRLSDAKSKSSASGKPILLLQTLGDIGGYA